MLAAAATTFQWGCKNLQTRLNGEKAISAMVKIRDGERAFRSNHGRFGTLEDLAQDKLIDPEIASGSYHQYELRVEATATTYKATASPVKPRAPGAWSLYVDQNSVIRSNMSGDAGPNDHAIP
jgi:hypothetical protein